MTDFAVPPGRDAVDGLAAIAAALDRGFDAVPHSRAQKSLDIVAIVCGWAVLVTVVLHPELQLAAIGLCAGFMVLRTAFRTAFGARAPSYL
ncbi:hypothetical protein [Bradyrhizobium guangdongense]|uniref:Uncharacterized protein n=1 Tax=Bradyrhizobium guangdongense TaxID=1325090 RepID=A0ABX6UEG2_9BRAD|nr:hypothetical protein [Bradyrhizobium guangdongense]QAU38452.1 hypothetical protein X265_12775 [Bradyrhizobium guangdongense]QOZ59507.1 hypothetical protein XH86_12765 [Bradyrhizobium guangdongense]